MCDNQEKKKWNSSTLNIKYASQVEAYNNLFQDKACQSLARSPKTKLFNLSKTRIS